SGHPALEFSVAVMNFFKQSLNFGIFLKFPRFLLENQVGPHTTGREVPDPFGIFASIGMRVEVTRPVITYFFQELDQQERCLNILRPEAEVLIESTWFLVVQVDVKQLTGFPG